jgi:Transposase DDE domain
MSKDNEKQRVKQLAGGMAWRIEWKLLEYYEDLLRLLDCAIDRRLVVTFVGLLEALILHRHRNEGGWMSQLGSYLVPTNAEAGKKRIQKLLYSRKWDSSLLEKYLWGLGERRVETGERTGETLLAIWDESVVEKSEALKLEGLGSVRSSKAMRLKRIKPGYFNPPGGRPIIVPGFHWLQVLICGMKGSIVPAHTRFWTNRGEQASTRRVEEGQVLQELANRLRARIIHVFDRGFAGTPWLTSLFVTSVRFVLRWPHRYHLVDESGNEKCAWEIARGKRSWEQRTIWDARRHCHRKIGLLAFAVFDPVFHQPLWLVISRQGSGKKPWYLLTSEPVYTPEQAFKIILIYARRWQVEMSLRFDKTELGFESLRAFSWEVRQRLFLLLALVHAFFLRFLAPDFAPLRDYLLNVWCHRNGERSRLVLAPLYRLRFALAFFWLRFPPPLLARLN